MDRRGRTVAAGVVVAGVVVTGAALVVPRAAAGAGPGEPGPGGEGTTLRFDVRFSPFQLVDVGEPGMSAGDAIVFHDTLLQGGREVGEVGSCVVVEPTPLANCTGVVRLGEQGTVTLRSSTHRRPRRPSR